jgi:glycosyltransferase involved in cell wall biosynthesis
MPPPKPREVRIGIVIPALDEQDSLPGVLRAIPRPPVSVVVVVDNGSRDRTAELARAGGAVLLLEPRRGYGSACQKGLAWLFGREPGAPEPPWGGGDIVVFLDADGSDRPEELARLVDPILRGEVEVVLGSRVLGGAPREALSPQQRFGNALACALMRLLFRARYTDLGPFRAIRADALEHLALSDLDYGWTVELQLKAAVAGLRVLEVPVAYRARSAGRSKISGTLLGSLGAGWKILGWILGWRLALWFTSRRIPRFPRSARSGC